MVFNKHISPYRNTSGINSASREKFDTNQLI